MASLFIIKGADQGKRFELKAKVVGLGRDNSNPIRLHDNEVSRRHAEVRRVDDAFRLVDLKLGQRDVPQRRAGRPGHRSARATRSGSARPSSSSRTRSTRPAAS